jgi:hypothetical protein
VVFLALVGLGGCADGTGITGSGSHYIDTRCTSADRWIVRGFQYEHFADAPADALLTATVRVGEVVPLQFTTLMTSDCGEAVANITWHSTAPAVATLTPTTRLEADLQARQAGETVVSAEAVLTDGSRVAAELYAVPQHGSPPLRVYTVRVVR